MNVTPIELLIHVGPHKTATTSIQALLARNRAVLAQHGYLYPSSPRMGDAHHHIPFQLKGWSLERIGLEEYQLPVSEGINSWFLEARELELTKIVVSAEDFSVLSETEWLEFGKQLFRSADNAHISIKNVTIVHNRRPMKARANSYYREAIKHGLALEKAEVLPSVEDQLTDADRVFMSLGKELGPNVRYLSVSLRDQETGKSFLQRWVSKVFGPQVYGELELEQGLEGLNSSISLQEQQELVQFNRLNTPDDAQGMRPLIRSSGENDRAWGRLRMFHHMLLSRDVAQGERDQARVERDQAIRNRAAAIDELASMQGSFSWRITKPLRVIRSRFRTKN